MALTAGECSFRSHRFDKIAGCICESLVLSAQVFDDARNLQIMSSSVVFAVVAMAQRRAGNEWGARHAWQRSSSQRWSASVPRSSDLSREQTLELNPA